MRSRFSQLLLAWYTLNHRNLPWRGIHDPYAIWISEIMLQQTQVNTVIPYYGRWMHKFPTLKALASSSEQVVLSEWEGLGYYSRARNLLRSAKIIQHELVGKFPSTVEGLLALPGIGKYTANAIASLVFGADVATLDANIRRVLARVFLMEKPARSLEGERELWQYAQKNVPSGKAGDYNQALMDLGATLCIPKKPQCDPCPLIPLCKAHRQGIEDSLPLLGGKPTIPHMTVTAAVITDHSKILIARRPSKGLLGGMWEFPGGKVEPGESLEECLAREIKEELGAIITVEKPIGTFHHAYSHFKVTLHCFWCKKTAGKFKALQHEELIWVRRADLGNYPMGKLDRMISKKLMTKQP
jgi:A/G-specific adenine glycosylase